MISINRNLLGLLLYIYIFINIINESPNYQKKKKKKLAFILLKNIYNFP